MNEQRNLGSLKKEEKRKNFGEKVGGRQTELKGKGKGSGSRKSFPHFAPARGI